MVEAEVNASDDSLCDKYLSQVDRVFTSGCAEGMFYSILGSYFVVFVFFPSLQGFL